jgi:hypothetical protein
MTLLLESFWVDELPLLVSVVLGVAVLAVFVFNYSGYGKGQTCPKCGKPNRRLARYCARCGARLPDDADSV